ncbi:MULTISPECIES: DUF2304 domain-containing protein [unclassified Nocardioides]|jgi:hypothetical protein|uniref:DUF2304 domain-containing protein n=1 Tax=unclassified Nocardioides TaxID=2615069 RepID=UPI0011525B50|nr:MULTISPECIES: DUF2304 domain-containing protein [unclassified Nocardioides]TQK70597.1 hypothetical protein FBY23_2376 [Nocardioides sp. SLBN-35]WGY00014.1 DUF2304 domain-containing protein [Nocardioides sp. QY071]
MIIRIFLIASIAVASWWLLRHPTGNRLALTRLAGMLVAAAAIVSVLAPSLVSDVAHRAGVEEGPHLLLYLLIVVFTFTSIAQAMRNRAIEHRVAELARAHALLQAAYAERCDSDA